MLYSREPDRHYLSEVTKVMVRVRILDMKTALYLCSSHFPNLYPQSNDKKNIWKSQTRDMPQNIWPVLLTKVIKNKESLRNSQPKGV